MEELRDDTQLRVSDISNWGVPLPIFRRGDSGETIQGADITAYIAQLVKQYGVSILYDWPVDQLLPPHYRHLSDQLSLD